MRIVEAGPLRVFVAGGTDGNGGGSGPSLVLCHGFGASGSDLVALHQHVDAGENVRWFFPEAPLAIDFGDGFFGRAWWPLDLRKLQEQRLRLGARALAGLIPEGMAEAREALNGCLKALQISHHVIPERTLLGGFSQGAMVTTELALSVAEPYTGLIALSGTLLNEHRWREVLEQTPGRAVFQSHGRADPILPYEGAEALRELLQATGQSVRFLPFDGGHEIPAIVLQGLGAFAREQWLA